tara:strand:+ start:6287 stop:6412 length:126 start_codon:yes stop_codon:yes gene_type:complete
MENNPIIPLGKKNTPISTSRGYASFAGVLELRKSWVLAINE